MFASNCAPLPALLLCGPFAFPHCGAHPFAPQCRHINFLLVVWRQFYCNSQERKRQPRKRIRRKEAVSENCNCNNSRIGCCVSLKVSQCVCCVLLCELCPFLPAVDGPLIPSIAVHCYAHPKGTFIVRLSERVQCLRLHGGYQFTITIITIITLTTSLGLIFRLQLTVPKLNWAFSLASPEG